MKYAVEMSSDIITYTYILYFVKIDSSIQKLIGGIYTATQTR
jgi:hypothetical protein